MTASAVEAGSVLLPLAILKPIARRMLGFVAFCTVVALIWHGIVTAYSIPHYIMPTPVKTWTDFLANHALVLDSLVITVGSAFAGMALAAVTGIVLAAIFVNSATVTKALLPIVIGLRTAPVVALAPLFIMIFGRGVWTSIAVVVIVAFFPILVNTMKGFTSTTRSSLEMMHVCGASRMQVLLKVRLPFALPFLFTGIRVASAQAILAAMLAEWLSGAPGLGFLILDSAALRDYGILWSAIVVSMFVAFSVFAVTVSVERALLTWTE